MCMCLCTCVCVCARVCICVCFRVDLMNVYNQEYTYFRHKIYTFRSSNGRTTDYITFIYNNLYIIYSIIEIITMYFKLKIKMKSFFLLSHRDLLATYIG